MERVYGALGLGAPALLTDRNWFALRNFHCHWFEDSGILNEYLHFQTMGVDEYVASVLDGSPWYVTLANKPVMRNIARLRWVQMLIRKFLMQPLAFSLRDSTMYWVQNDMQDRISAFFKDKQSWQAIPSAWDDIRRPNYQDYRRLDHGYDESLGDSELDLSQMQRGGALQGREMHGLVDAGRRFIRAVGLAVLARTCIYHDPERRIEGRPLVPACEPSRNGWDYDQEARNNPFFAQVWYPNHDLTEAQLLCAGLLP